jgi:hypothetical protein
MNAAAEIARRAIQVVRQLGPYAAIELLLPGGSLLAILLWLYRRYRARQKDLGDVRPLMGGSMAGCLQAVIPE